MSNKLGYIIGGEYIYDDRDLELKLNNKINFNTCTYHI